MDLFDSEFEDHETRQNFFEHNEGLLFPLWTSQFTKKKVSSFWTLFKLRAEISDWKKVQESTMPDNDGKRSALAVDQSAN